MTLEEISSFSMWMILPIGLVGSLLHFAFDWSKHNRIVARFAAVNESYWEHIKIAIWPSLALQIVLFALGGYRYPSFIPAATAALYSIPVAMIGLVFLYKRMTKRNILWIDITTFFVVIAISQTLFSNLLSDLNPSAATTALSAFFLVGLITAFAMYTVRPPREPDFFIDPTNRKYGLGAHPDIEGDT